MQTRVAISIMVIWSIFSGCGDMGDPLAPVPEGFDIQYRFVNHGDPDISAIEIVSLTYYPRVNRSWYSKQNFQRPGPTDTLVSYAPDPGYQGCLTQMGLLVIKDWQPNSHYWRYFTFARDTVVGVNDHVTVFNWPEDTTRSVELPWAQ